MPEVIISDYFYGDEAEMFQYFHIPRRLISQIEYVIEAMMQTITKIHSAAVRHDFGE